MAENELDSMQLLAQMLRISQAFANYEMLFRILNELGRDPQGQVHLDISRSKSSGEFTVRLITTAENKQKMRAFGNFEQAIRGWFDYYEAEIIRRHLVQAGD